MVDEGVRKYLRTMKPTPIRRKKIQQYSTFGVIGNQEGIFTICFRSIQFQCFMVNYIESSHRKNYFCLNNCTFYYC